MRTAPNPMLEEKEQYHHYIPRFVLRAFAPDPQPVYDEPTRPVRKRKKQRKKKSARITAGGTAGGTEDPRGVEDDSPDEAGPSNALPEAKPSVEPEVVTTSEKPKPRRPRFDPSKDPYIKFYDLESGVLDFRKVGRVYGIPDMYKDADNERVNHVEQSLSKLESDVARIYQKIRKDHESGSRKFLISRDDLNLLRKFLFVMRYRGHRFWSKYTGTIDTYKHLDREMLIQFLKEKAITDLRQVWLLGLEVIMKTPIDADGDWLEIITREMFAGDANMYVFHIRESYMALLEPDSPEDEFILTDNGYGIFEGPVEFDIENLESTGTNGSRPRLKDRSYTEYHKLAPLSPRLMLVLRSNFLRDGPIWEKRLKFFRELAAWPKADSLLQDLPIKPPQVRYKLSAKVKTLEDEFSFELFRAKTEQIRLINTVMLQEAKGAITWVSDESLVKSLHAYLGNPSFLLQTPLGLFPESTPLFALRYQKQRLLSLCDMPYPTEGMRPLDELQQMSNNLRKDKHLQSYFKFGGEPELYRYDVHQATLLIQFRSFVADHSGSVLNWRNKVNRATLKFMSTFHPRIVWLHVKMWKISAQMIRKGLELSLVTESDTDMFLEPGPEDLIAKLVEFLPFNILSMLMLEVSLKGMHRLDTSEKMAAKGLSTAEIEKTLMFKDIGMMDQFGGFSGS
ncbi:hypothetical protein L873DRAFT_1511473 [Choiromyces venosus 120613-1]|uniref:Uncharacterized protein n=1 Tax=Choiromyces venosus 120613-1 TaxID=1336337 RepID=A0A3N4J641_9PEZI|nr:hypothetical protein L873DRAFT_1511473 [Choiromyces venosus 120613-1]